VPTLKGKQMIIETEEWLNEYETIVDAALKNILAIYTKRMKKMMNDMRELKRLYGDELTAHDEEELTDLIEEISDEVRKAIVKEGKLSAEMHRTLHALIEKHTPDGLKK
jgi:hypothetical protein